ncbi:hypothetical protein AB0D04_09525 [Streptomyces sp. NPDC048483]|uniref:hypothetical protein n=1 Tax=Streptomyces sp. NPDC048483 TaxID=3154927 RepID=UPI003430BE62
MSRTQRTIATIAIAAAMAGGAAAPAMADSHTPKRTSDMTVKDTTTPISGTFTTQDSTTPTAPAGIAAP